MQLKCLLKRILLPVVLALAMLPSLSRAQIQVQSQAYSAGGVKVYAPTPEGFLAFSTLVPELFSNRMQKDDDKLLEFYCYLKDGQCVQGRAMKLRWMKERADHRFTDAEFVKFRASYRTDFESTGPDCKLCLEQAKQMKPDLVSIDLNTIFADNKQYFGVSSLYTYTTYRTVISTAIINVKGRLLYLHAESTNPDDVQWSQDMLKQWVTQVLAHNEIFALVEPGN